LFPTTSATRFSACAGAAAINSAAARLAAKAALNDIHFM
jgi:hypothetical protein